MFRWPGQQGIAMTKPDKGTAASASIYVRVTWGAYGLNFTVNSTDTPTLNCHDKHQTIVEVAPFDSEKHVTTHPVQLTCTATGHFTLSRSLDEAFNLLAIDQLPKGSKSEDKLPKESSYSIPYDLYPRNVQIFMSETFSALYECASRVWRLLRWRLSALGSHALFETILASEWSRDGHPPWRPFAVKLTLSASIQGIPQLDAFATESVQNLLTTDAVEPTSEELLREARSLHMSNPRAALMLAVAAAEVGVKELLIDLVPQVEWFTLHVQSPPLVGLLKNSLSQLPVRQGAGTPAPQEVVNVMERAIKARNNLAHQGRFRVLDVNLEEVTNVVESLLKQFEYYRGFAWVTPVWS